MSPADAIHVVPDRPATASIIWLHGLGADGHDFEPVVHALGLAQRGVRVVLPHAPQRPVTINGGYVMRAWYDVRDPDLTHDQDAEGIRASAALVTRRIEDEKALGIVPGRILLAGFSQGGAVALHTGLRYPERLAGIIALSTYLPLSGQLAKEAHEENRNTPIFMGHGISDPLIPLVQGEASVQELTSLGYAVEFRRYGMPHGVCPQEIEHIDRWLQTVLD
jgi:phospholipase/carboxylesterase